MKSRALVVRMQDVATLAERSPSILHIYVCAFLSFICICHLYSIVFL